MEFACPSTQLASPHRGSSIEHPQSINCLYIVQIKSLFVCSMEAQFALVEDVHERPTELLTPRAQLEVKEGVCGVGLRPLLAEEVSSHRETPPPLHQPQ